MQEIALLLLKVLMQSTLSVAYGSGGVISNAERKEYSGMTWRAALKLLRQASKFNPESADKAMACVQRV